MKFSTVSFLALTLILRHELQDWVWSSISSLGMDSISGSTCVKYRYHQCNYAPSILWIWNGFYIFENLVQSRHHGTNIVLRSNHGHPSRHHLRDNFHRRRAPRHFMQTRHNSKWSRAFHKVFYRTVDTKYPRTQLRSQLRRNFECGHIFDFPARLVLAQLTQMRGFSPRWNEGLSASPVFPVSIGFF